MNTNKKPLSDRQLAANRANAQKSTGPKTEAGKNTARENAIKHGMTASRVLLPHESEDAYLERLEGLRESWQPEGAQEEMLVEQIAAAYRRIERSRIWEREALSHLIDWQKSKNGLPQEITGGDTTGLAITSINNPKTKLELFFRYDRQAERAYYQAVEQLRKLQKDRHGREAKLRKEQLEAEKAIRKQNAKSMTAGVSHAQAKALFPQLSEIGTGSVSQPAPAVTTKAPPSTAHDKLAA